MNNDNFGGWPGLAYRVGSLLFYIVLGILDGIGLTCLWIYVSARWLA